MQVQPFWESESISARYPRKFRCTYLWHKIRMTAPEMVVPDQGFGVDSTEDTRRVSISVALPNSSPIRNMNKKRFQHIKHIMTATSGVTAMPSQFREFQSELFPRIWTAWARKRKSRFLVYFFKTSYERSCIVLDRCVGHVSRTEEKNKRTSFSLVGWCKLSN